MKPTSTNVFLQFAKNVKVTRGKIWAVRRMLKRFRAKSLKLIPHQIGSMGTGVIMQNDDSVRQHSRVFSLYGASQNYQPRRNESHLSALLFLPPFPMLNVHTLHYAHLQSNKETTVWACPFSLPYIRLLSYRWSIDTQQQCCQLLREMCFMAFVRFSFDCPSCIRISAWIKQN